MLIVLKLSEMNLQLSLKKQWFEMTKQGIKTEDYREITPYWIKRLVNDLPMKNMAVAYLTESALIKGLSIERGFKKFTQNTMTLGYPKSTDSERILKFEHKGIEIGYGNPEWGAEPNKLYFIIKHGKKL
jgi:hypothetical protein